MKRCIAGSSSAPVVPLYPGVTQQASRLIRLYTLIARSSVPIYFISRVYSLCLLAGALWKHALVSVVKHDNPNISHTHRLAHMRRERKSAPAGVKNASLSG